MTEHPILFSGPMVRAIIAGRKTQTRRVVKPQPPEQLADTVHYDRATGGCMWASIRGDHGTHCPYGVPGDRLWVRETIEIDGYLDLYYVADDIAVECEGMPGDWKYRGPEWTGKIPAIHMPRWACRLVLEVTAVRVERLQAITSDDAIDEGIEPHDSGDAREEDAFNLAGFEELWDSINAKRGFGWAENPWVWVVQFRKLD